MSKITITYLGFGISAQLHFIKNYNLEAEIIIIDPLLNKENTKNLCSFTDNTTLPFSHKWSTIKFDSNIKTTSVPYKKIDNTALQSKINKLINEHPNCRLIESKVEYLSAERDYYTVTANAKKIKTDQIIDSRPPNVYPIAKLFQHFLGFHIEIDHNINSPEIMDIQENNLCLEFFYILPLSKNELLVELTYFSSELYCEKHYKEKIKEYLKGLKIEHYKVTSVEKGVIPLIKIKNKIKLKNYTSVGIRAGAMRPSTGYSVLKANEYSSNNSSLRWDVITFLDRVFLQVLYDSPEKSKVIFKRFSKLNGKIISNFMSTAPSTISIIKVIFKMPKLLFIKGLVKVLITKGFICRLREINE